MVSAFLTAFITIIIVYFLSKASGKDVQPVSEGVFRLKALKAYLYLGIVTLLLGVFFIVFSVIMYLDNEPIGVAIIGVVMGALFSYGGVYCYLLQKNYEVLFDDDEIKVTNFKNKQKVLKWKEVKSAKFNSVSAALKITSRYDESKTVTIHQYTKGIKQFLKMFIDKTGIPLKETKMPIKLD